VPAVPEAMQSAGWDSRVQERSQRDEKRSVESGPQKAGRHMPIQMALRTGMSGISKKRDRAILSATQEFATSSKIFGVVADQSISEIL
jgi:hypothetical protein